MIRISTNSTNSTVSIGWNTVVSHVDVHVHVHVGSCRRLNSNQISNRRVHRIVKIRRAFQILT